MSSRISTANALFINFYVSHGATRFLKGFVKHYNYIVDNLLLFPTVNECRVVTLVMTAQTMSFRYELACKAHSREKAQDLVT